MKKYTLPAAVAVMVIQLLTVCSLIVYAMTVDGFIDKKGTEYKFEAVPISICDGKVSFELSDGRPYSLRIFDSSYAGISTGENGLSHLYAVGKSEGRPEEYINIKNDKAFPYVRSYELPKEYRDIDFWFSYMLDEVPTGYVAVKVYNGKSHIMGFYVGDRTIEEYIDENEIGKDEFENLFDDEDRDLFSR